jgi:ribosome modulation factor
MTLYGDGGYDRMADRMARHGDMGFGAGLAGRDACAYAYADADGRNVWALEAVLKGYPSSGEWTICLANLCEL